MTTEILSRGHMPRDPRMLRPALLRRLTVGECIKDELPDGVNVLSRRASWFKSAERARVRISIIVDGRTVWIALKDASEGRQ